MSTLFGEDKPKMDSGAVFSQDRKCRYVLYRIWDKTKPCVAFIGLNPSTANESKPDPTITRVMNFAKGWGYGGVYMYNLFGVVSSDPEILTQHRDPSGENDRFLYDLKVSGIDVIFAWGNHKEAQRMIYEVMPMFPEARCLRKNKNGTPIHPLYVKADTIPIKFN